MHYRGQGVVQDQQRLIKALIESVISKRDEEKGSVQLVTIKEIDGLLLRVSSLYNNSVFEVVNVQPPQMNFPAIVGDKGLAIPTRMLSHSAILEEISSLDQIEAPNETSYYYIGLTTFYNSLIGDRSLLTLINKDNSHQIQFKLAATVVDDGNTETARKNDTVVANAATDPTFFAWVSAVSVVTGQVPPASLTGKITTGYNGFLLP